MTTQIFLASTLYGATTLAAALDSGCYPADGRRLLVTSTNAAVPETATPVDRMPGFAAVRRRFDDVVSWNEAVRPFHPGDWSPRPDDAPLWERHLRLLWGIGGDEPVELVVESIQVEPALAVAACFPDSPIDVYADGLMSYGPTRNRLDPLVHTRIRRLLHLDLVPGLVPLLLSEHGVRSEVIPREAFLKALTDVSGASGDDHLSGPDSPALLLGQYLSALGILTADEEERLHVRMLRGAAGEGHRRVVFKPHPTAPARYSRALEEEADALGVELTVLDTPVLAETLYERMRPALVVGCFSTALLTAAEFYGIPAARVGTGLLLERLTPYQNSNRVPVTIVDALLRDLEHPDEPAVDALPQLVAAVGYCMQAQAYPHLRDGAAEYLATHLTDRTRRYVKRRRTASLGLPGEGPAGLAAPRLYGLLAGSRTARRVVRRVRTLGRALLSRAPAGHSSRPRSPRG